jgi:hypothetical protein
MENMKEFVQSQNNIKKVALIFELTDTSSLTPILTQLLNLNSLVNVKIAIDDALSNLSAEAIKNRHVQALHVDDVTPEAFGPVLSKSTNFCR